MFTQIFNRRRQTPELRRDAPLAVHRPSACSGVKACPWLEQGALRNTSDAKAASRQATLAFRSLDPFRALREPDPRRRDEERPFQLRTKNCQQTQTTITDQLPSGGKAPLTGKAPYKSGANLSLSGIRLPTSNQMLDFAKTVGCAASAAPTRRRFAIALAMRDLGEVTKLGFGVEGVKMCRSEGV